MYTGPDGERKAPPALGGHELVRALRWLGVRPTTRLLKEHAADVWRHRTHRAYDANYARLVAVLAQSDRERRPISCREQARRARVDRASAYRYDCRLIASGVWLRLEPSGQILAPGSGQLPKVSPDRKATATYVAVWTPDLTRYLPTERVEAVTLAWHLARGGFARELVARWVSWPRGLALLRAAWDRQVASERRRRRRRRRAERKAAARQERRTAALSGSGPLAGALATIAGRVRIERQSENCNGGGEGVPGANAPGLPNAPARARAGPEPAPEPSDTDTNALEDLYRLATTIGEPRPISLQRQMTLLAEEGEATLPALVGEYQRVVDHVREELANPALRANPIRRPAALAWWRFQQHSMRMRRML